ncbi:MAG: hypothetical protein ABW321_22435 [Polyangiales bacterium]
MSLPIRATDRALSLTRREPLRQTPAEPLRATVAEPRIEKRWSVRVEIVSSETSPPPWAARTTARDQDVATAPPPLEAAAAIGFDDQLALTSNAAVSDEPRPRPHGYAAYALAGDGSRTAHDQPPSAASLGAPDLRHAVAAYTAHQADRALTASTPVRRLSVRV